VLLTWVRRLVRRVCAANNIKAAGAKDLAEALTVNTSVTSIDLGCTCRRAPVGLVVVACACGAEQI